MGNIVMKQTSLAIVILVAAFSGESMAVCPAPGGSQFVLSDTQISNLVTGQYACGAQSATQRWNELHSGGRIIEYKDPPAEPSEDVGSYTIAAGSPATITYDYGPGSVYTYCVIGAIANNVASPPAGTYGFYNTGSSAAIRVRISPNATPRCF